MKKNILPLLVGIVLAAALYFGLSYLYPESTWVPGQSEVTPDDSHAYHVHSDFAMYINGEKFNFSQEKYMISTDVCHIESNTKKLHLHDMNGDVAHVHEAGHTWGDFFASLGFELSDDSVKLDDGRVYKNAGSITWDFYVNGKEVPSLKSYPFKDLDRVLLRYGDTFEQVSIQQEIASVTKKACIYSKTCPVPEGVVLPAENCGS